MKAEVQSFGVAAVLCGGASRRMGFDKSLIPSAGAKGWLMDELLLNLLDNFSQVLTMGACSYTLGLFPEGMGRSTKVEEALASGQIRFLLDSHQGSGPISGLLAAAESSLSTWFYVTACDMPFIEARHIDRLKKYTEAPARVVMGSSSSGFEPFQAFYKRDLAIELRRWLSDEKRSLRGFLDSLPPEVVIKSPVGDLEELIYFNINDPECLRHYHYEMSQLYTNLKRT